MNILGIDVGAKKIGLAVGSTESSMAFTRPALLVASWDEAWEPLMDLIDQEKIDQLVVGWPLNTNGSSGPQTLEVEKFVEALSQHVDLPIDQRDERFTSQAVQREQVGRQLKRGEEDSLAAQLLVESYLHEHAWS